MIKLLLIIFIQKSQGFCEAYWISNSTAYQSNSTENISEVGNAISSLSYSIFGLIGIILRYNTTMYYLLMNLFILLGIASFLHHYNYSNADWAYSADIISMELVTTFSLLYILCDIEYNQSKLFNKFCGFLIISSSLSMIILNTVKPSYRTLILKIFMGSIIASQAKICIHLCILDLMIKYRVFLTLVWSSILFTLAAVMWHIDNDCPYWTINKLNGHTIWHICTAWSLFNVINISTIYRCLLNQTKYTWIPLIECCPWFIFIVKLSNEKTNLIHEYTAIDLDEIKLISYGCKNHRRNRTIG